MSRLLFVDDEPQVLDSFRRAFRKRYELDTACGSVEGLQAIEQRGPYAVIVSDMRMPGMDGVQFLARAREVAPDSVRIMLTGATDRETAVSAINEGHIFRFLAKPCSAEALAAALEAGLQQHRLLTAEKELARAERRYREIVDRANRELEEKVEERTRELRHAVERLQEEFEEKRRAQEALRESEERLRQSQKLEALGRLAGGVAHDFNNLLTAIIGYSDLLLLQPEPSGPQRFYAEEIRRAGEHAASLTRQLLAFSRNQVLQPVVLNLNAIVTDMSTMLRRLIGEDIRLSTSLDPRLSALKADPGQLAQIIVNLVVNARDAVAAGGDIVISTANVEVEEDCAAAAPALGAGRYVTLEVSDNGCGMSEEILARLFDPFFTTKEPGKGTGLGLSTVYGIVRQCGGQVDVRSRVGRGATFTVYLPAGGPPASTTAETGGARPVAHH